MSILTKEPQRRQPQKHADSKYTDISRTGSAEMTLCTEQEHATCCKNTTTAACSDYLWIMSHNSIHGVTVKTDCTCVRWIVNTIEACRDETMPQACTANFRNWPTRVQIINTFARTKKLSCQRGCWETRTAKTLLWHGRNASVLQRSGTTARLYK